MKKASKLLTLLSIILLFAACQPLTPNQEESHSTTESTKPKQINIYLARHGKTMLNTTDRSQGWIDAPLTPIGVSVAKELGRGLQVVDFDAVYSSDSGRARETATLVLENNGQKELIPTVIHDPRLREYNFGTFEGLPNEEMWAAIAKEQQLSLEEWQAQLSSQGFVKTIEAFSNTLHQLDEDKLKELAEENQLAVDEVSWQAEDYQSVVKRATAALDEMVATAEKNGQDDILVVSHGMTIATLLATLDSTVAIPSTGLKNASISKIVFKDQQYFVETVNDVSYLENN